MNPTERLLTILRLIDEAGGLTTTTHVRGRMSGDYEEVAGEKKWGRDLKMLRSRGLLESDLSTPTTPRRTGLRRLPMRAKKEDLHLTADEHVALIQARKVLRDGMPEVSVLDRPAGEREASIDVAMRVLRFVEEHGDEVEVDQLARWLKQSPAAVRRLLEGLMEDVVVLDAPLVLSLAPAYGGDEDDTDEDAEGPELARVYVLRLGTDSRRPLRRKAMDELGFFPYSLAETDDRLGLIAEALGSEAIDETTRHHLRWAQSKLEHWRSILTEESMS